MKVDIILGLQWGDEGKGKIVDLLSRDYEVIARFQGGPNAGHTIIIEDKKFVLHQIPSGIIREGIMNIIGNAVILDPIIFMKEIDQLLTAGVSVKERLIISRKANLILPTHRLLDAAQEKSKGKVGSTLKGIGPTYQDKIGRFGIRLGDTFASDFQQKYKESLERHIKILNALTPDEQISINDIDDTAWLSALDQLKQFTLGDTEIIIQEYLTQGKKILAEGAQGSLLDIDFGTYPFVTSSNTLASGVCNGLGISPKQIGKVYGVFKAYTTRVGEGPFPTELNNEIGEQIRKVGNEFGSTTGRPRRVGWLDMPALKYSCLLNGVDELLMMKADVMNNLDEISIGVKYQNINGDLASVSDLSFTPNQISVVYENHNGWRTEIKDCKEMNQLPQELQNYIHRVEELSGCPITLVSLGPERNQTITAN